MSHVHRWRGDVRVFTCMVLVAALAISPFCTHAEANVSEEQRLDAAAREMAQRLSEPVAPSFRENHAWGHFIRDLSIAADWPHPLFRKPLLAILNGDEPKTAYKAARALAGYADMETQQLVAKIVKQRWFERDAEVWREFTRLPLPQADVNRFIPQAGLFPMSAEEGVLIPDYYSRRMTVPAALEALHGDDLSIRLQTVVWLAQAGLVVDLGPLEEAWPQLSECARAGVLKEMIGEPRTGADLRREWVRRHLADWEKAGERVRSALLMWGAPVGCRELLPLARRIVDAYEAKLAADPHAGLDLSSDQCNCTVPVEAALFAIRELEAPIGNTLRDALRWARSYDRTLRSGGCCILAHSDDWRAAYAVFGSVASDQMSFYPLDVESEIADREWKNNAIQQFWLRGLCRLLEAELDDYADKQRVLVRPTGKFSGGQRIKLMRAIAQTKVGSDDLLHGVVEVSKLRETANLWDQWITAHDADE